jgi:hypothetical protein
LVAAGCGDGDDDAARTEPARTPAPDTHVVEGDGELAVGITEPNPNFVRTGDVAEPFGRWRDELHKMRPRYYRLAADWAGVSSEDGREFDFEKPNGGCMRDVEPCAGFAGVRGQLEALAEAQKKYEGSFEVLVVLTGTPEVFAAPPAGCERGGTQPRSRPPRDEQAYAVYGKLITRLFDLAREVGVELRYWSPWNEPNHPFFISPQRTRCKSSAPSAAVEPYVRFARTLQKELANEDGDQTMVLGEFAGLLERKSGYTRGQEFVAELPKDLVCAAPIFSQHGYVGGPDPVEKLAAALARHGCPDAHEIWMTETGAGRPRRGEERDRSEKSLLRSCRSIAKRLRAWYEDPRVTAAFQYTLREDDRFPTGLVSTELDDAYPALKEWQAWGGDRDPADPAPKTACA